MNVINYSIIIPHYNIPDLLMRCLKSIPVREDIQVIVVDDCSPDANRYLKDYPELSRPYLEYYSTPKGGSAGRARNVGLDHAKGKWLIFIDSDDLFVKDIKTVLDTIVNFQEDILFYNTISRKSNDLSQRANRNSYTVNYFIQYLSDHKETTFRYAFPSLWGKIIKRELVQTHNIRFDETRYSNDVIFSLLTGHFAKQIFITTKPLYIVTEREGSLASSLYGKNKMSLDECLIRFDVALNAKVLHNKWNIYGFYYQFYDISKKIKDYYPLAYIKLVFRLFFIHPYYAFRLIRRDFRQLFQKLSAALVFKQ